MPRKLNVEIDLSSQINFLLIVVPTGWWHCLLMKIIDRMSRMFFFAFFHRSSCRHSEKSLHFLASHDRSIMRTMVRSHQLNCAFFWAGPMPFSEATLAQCWAKVGTLAQHWATRLLLAGELDFFLCLRKGPFCGACCRLTGTWRLSLRRSASWSGIKKKGGAGFLVRAPPASLLFAGFCVINTLI